MHLEDDFNQSVAEGFNLVAASGIAGAFALVFWAVMGLSPVLWPQSKPWRRFGVTQSLPSELATKRRKAAACCCIMILP